MSHATTNGAGAASTLPIHWAEIDARLGTLEQVAAVGTTTPDMKHRKGVKRWLARLVARGVCYVTRFMTTRQSHFNAAATESARALASAILGLQQALEEEGRRLELTLDEQAQGQQVKLDQALVTQQRRQERRLEQALQEQSEALRSHDLALQGQAQRLEERVSQALQQQEDRLGRAQQEHRAHFQAHFAETIQTQILEAEKRLTQRIHPLERAAGQPDPVLIARLHELEKQVSQLKTALLCQERRTSLLLEEASRRLPEPFNREQLEAISKEEQHSFDSIYVAFEDRFRGSRELIKQRLKIYLPYLNRLPEGIEALDVGCGRGEWLELLGEIGIKARGLDSNRAMVAQCRERGLDVTQGDVIAHLRDLPGNSLGLLTAFHIIEHLPLKAFIALLDEAFRILKPGGLAIFETPNPQNVLVGSFSFYMDPTHRNPMPSPMVKFFVENRGFSHAEVLNLHPFPEGSYLHGTELAERFSHFFYGPQDYAVLAWKL
jgi:ubiquinone/menaquinone biosynthesis C-methylase UbiE